MKKEAEQLAKSSVGVKLEGLFHDPSGQHCNSKRQRTIVLYFFVFLPLALIRGVNRTNFEHCDK